MRKGRREEGGKKSIGEAIEQLDPYYSAVGNVNWYNHLGKLIAPTKAEYIPPRYIPSRNAYIYPLKNTYMFSHSSIICNSPKLDTTQTAVKNRMTVGTSLVVQWLRLCASSAGGACLIPAGGTKIPRGTVKK